MNSVLGPHVRPGVRNVNRMRWLWLPLALVLAVLIAGMPLPATIIGVSTVLAVYFVLVPLGGRIVSSVNKLSRRQPTVRPATTGR